MTPFDDPRIQEAVYDRLKQIARDGATTTYAELKPLLGLDPGKAGDNLTLSRVVGPILDRISRREHEEGRPMLSAVVLHQGSPLPGDGFFKLARELGRLTGEGGRNEWEFHREELARVHAQWRTSS